MDKKIMINLEKYGMQICPRCNSDGFIQDPHHQPCPKCGGFGVIKKEEDIPPGND